LFRLFHAHRARRPIDAKGGIVRIAPVGPSVGKAVWRVRLGGGSCRGHIAHSGGRILLGGGVHRFGGPDRSRRGRRRTWRGVHPSKPTRKLKCSLAGCSGLQTPVVD
jgi:hypothetical protein